MSAAFWRKYNTVTHVFIPIIKRNVVDFAVAADWTPAAGDVRVSIDGAASSNIGTLPTAITMGNTAMWDFTLSGTETTGKKIMVTVADAATKTVEDQMFLVETYGNAAAEYQADLSLANLPANVVQIEGVALGTHAAGLLPADVRQIVGAVVSTAIAQLGVNLVSTSTDAITAASLAADTIGSSELATTAVNEIRDSILSDSTPFQGARIDAAISSRLAPTTAGRTLDISTGGEAGIDWANIGTPGAAQTLSATSINTVTGAVGSVSGSIGSLAAQAKTDVNNEMVDALAVDTYTEPGQGAPGVQISLAAKIGYLYKAFRNKITQDSTTLRIFADDMTTVDQKAVVSDDGTTYTRNEIATGP